MRKSNLVSCLLLILIVSCSGVPKNSEQLTMSNEQLAMSSEQLTVSSEQAPTELAIAEPTDTVELSNAAEFVSEPSVSVETVAEEEKPQTEYVETLSLLDETEPQEVVREPEVQSTVALETLRPVKASPAEQTAPAEPASPAESVPKPTAQVLPERRTAQVVPPDFSPPVRDSWKQFPKEETPATTQESVVEEPPEERILLQDYPITFSRVARATVGQLVEIPFRGRDWVFLGEVGARRGIAYNSRKLDPEGESFVFRVDAAGVYALKFYRQDFTHDFILNDHVQIIAGRAPETTGLAWFNPPTDRSKVVAGPRWPNFLEQPPLVSQSPPVATQPPVTEQTPVATQPLVSQPSEAIQSPSEPVKPPAPATVQPPAAPPAVVRPPATAQPPAAPPARQPSTARNEAPRPQGLSSGGTVAQAGPAQPQASPPAAATTGPTAAATGAAEPKSPDTILKEAREEFNAGRVASAITLLDQFCKSFPSGSDEAWWLYGQCYEANSPNRNMLSALEYYRRLVREYPMSSRLSDARRRISYLERYYINIQ